MQREINGTIEWEQIQRVKKEALYQLAHYHERDKRQKLKDRIKKAAGRYVPPEDVIFWPTGLLACALMECSLWIEDEEVLKGLVLYFDRWIERGMPVYYIDDLLAGTVLFDLYRKTGEEKYKAGADKMADYLKRLIMQETDKGGSLPYRPAQKNGHIYVDGIGMISPFLVGYGMEYGDQAMVETGLLQISNMLKYGMDVRTGLPYHGYEYENKVKYGIIGWGRAVGWLLTGMSGVLKYLWPDTRRCGWLVDAFKKLIMDTVKHQKENGAFAWQLEAAEGPDDSSATAMIAKSILTALQYDMVAEESPAYSICERALTRAGQYLASCEREGKIYDCSGECLGFSQYPQIYGSYPWSLGPGLSVLMGTLYLRGGKIMKEE